MRCGACGGPLRAKPPNERGRSQVYCSNACRKVAWRRRHRVPLGARMLAELGLPDVSLMTLLASRDQT